MAEIDLVTCENVIEELRKITIKKLKYLGDRSLEVALLELDRAVSDIEVMPKTGYAKKIKAAEQLITHTKDVPILAAVLEVLPDYFISGDAHFFTEKIKNIVKIKTAKEFLSETT